MSVNFDDLQISGVDNSRNTYALLRARGPEHNVLHRYQSKWLPDLPAGRWYLTKMHGPCALPLNTCRELDVLYDMFMHDASNSSVTVTVLGRELYCDFATMKCLREGRILYVIVLSCYA